MTCRNWGGEKNERKKKKGLFCPCGANLVTVARSCTVSEKRSMKLRERVHKFRSRFIYLKKKTNLQHRVNGLESLRRFNLSKVAVLVCSTHRMSAQQRPEVRFFGTVSHLKCDEFHFEEAPLDQWHSPGGVSGLTLFSRLTNNNRTSNKAATHCFFFLEKIFWSSF